MKKIYNAPQTKEHKITLNSMVCNSLSYGGHAVDHSIKSADSRDVFFFDDDDWDDFED